MAEITQILTNDLSPKRGRRQAASPARVRSFITHRKTIDLSLSSDGQFGQVCKTPSLSSKRNFIRNILKLNRLCGSSKSYTPLNECFPPYKEIAGRTVGVNLNRAHDLYADKLAVANRELFAQFMMRIYFEIPSCTLAVFSKLKTLQGSNFSGFREHFLAQLRSLFVVPADTFDNVDGDFPIGFQIWDTKCADVFRGFSADVFDRESSYIGTKMIYLPEKGRYFSNWIVSNKAKDGTRLGWLDGCTYNDFQKCRYLNIQNDKPVNNSQPRGAYIYDSNLVPYCVAFAVRLAISANWLNDRDQFMVPKSSWEADAFFQTDCLVYTLFHGQNRITSSLGTNHWIPFREEEVNSPAPFNSRFMVDFLEGKYRRKVSGTMDNLFEQQAAEKVSVSRPLDSLSEEAKTLLDAGRELWLYYMSKPGINVNASFLDIRAYFQGYKTTETGRRMMNSTSTDEHYTELLSALREKLKALEARIEPKIYEYGFLLK